MKVLKHNLKVSGLRQSPWIAPRPTVMKGVLKESVTIDVCLNFQKLYSLYIGTNCGASNQTYKLIVIAKLRSIAPLLRI